MKLVGFFLLCTAAYAQDPFRVAPQEYHLDFENEYVRIVRVTYPPYGKTSVHTHPALPTIFVYPEDAGPIEFSHSDGPAVRRKPVRRGQIRFNRGMEETHVVENLSDQPNNYLRVELKTKKVELPLQDVRLDPENGFENSMIRITRRPLTPPEFPGVDISYSAGRGVFVKKGFEGPVPDVRIELKTPPAATIRGE